MNKLVFGDQVKVIKDSCEGSYNDLIGKTLMVIDTETEDNILFYHVYGTDRSVDYLDFNEDIVLASDCELA